MHNDGSLYRVDDQIYTYEELRASTEEQVADLPPETWRDGVFNFDDYLTESLHTGTIDVIDDEDEDDPDEDWRHDENESR